VKTSCKRSGSAKTSGSPGSILSAQREFALLGRGSVNVDRQIDQRIWIDAAFMQIDAAGLDAGQIEQVIDDGLQSLAILACGKEQVGLLREKNLSRADGLFGAQVNRHVQARSAAAEFVPPQWRRGCS